MSFPRCNALFLDFFKFTTNAIPDHIAWKRAKFLSKCFSMLLSYRGKCNGLMANIGLKNEYIFLVRISRMAGCVYRLSRRHILISA